MNFKVLLPNKAIGVPAFRLFCQTVYKNQWAILASVGIGGTYPQNVDHFLEHYATQSVQAMRQYKLGANSL